MRETDKVILHTDPHWYNQGLQLISWDLLLGKLNSFNGIKEGDLILSRSIINFWKTVGIQFILAPILFEKLPSNSVTV